MLCMRAFRAWSKQFALLSLRKTRALAENRPPPVQPASKLQHFLNLNRATPAFSKFETSPAAGSTDYAADHFRQSACDRAALLRLQDQLGVLRGDLATQA